MEKEICEHCAEPLQPLNPEAEEYLEHKFCINLFGWKLMLVKDYIEYGCTFCIVSAQEAEKYDAMEEAVGYAIQEEVRKGNLFYKD